MSTFAPWKIFLVSYDVFTCKNPSIQFQAKRKTMLVPVTRCIWSYLSFQLCTSLLMDSHPCTRKWWEHRAIFWSFIVRKSSIPSLFWTSRSRASHTWSVPEIYRLCESFLKYLYTFVWILINKKSNSYLKTNSYSICRIAYSKRSGV